MNADATERIAADERAPGADAAGLHRFIPPALVRWPVLGEQREHHAAVLFLDVAGFTRLAETLAARGPEGAELLDRTIADYFDSLMDVVDRFGGWAIKIAGDALTLLFLEEEASLDRAAARAVACAALLAEARGAADSFELAHKIGVGCGRLFAGVVGDPATRQELVYGGPALDQAVRAEKEAVAGEVWVSHEAARRARLPTFAGGEGCHRLVDADRAALEGQHLSLAPPTLRPEDFERWRDVVPRAVLEHAAGSSVEYLCRHQSITVLFAGVPTLVLDRPESIDVVAQHYAAMSEIITAHGGFLSEFESGDKGSKLIITFGAPAVLEAPGAQAVRCAWAMQEKARAMDLVSDQRIGVATGRLFVGRIGCRSIVKYSALGDRMNLAARLMSKAGEWEVLAEAQTVRRTNRHAQWGEERSIQVKGKAEAVQVHALEGLSQLNRRIGRGLGMVGRGEEMGRISALLEGLSAPRGAILDVVGAAGTGKTRLAMAVWRTTTDRYGLECHLWRGATVERRADPLLPWAALLRELIGLPAQPDADQRREDFEAWVDALPADRRSGARLLAPLLDVELPADPIFEGLDSARRLTLQREALLEALSQGCADGPPRVLILDEAERLDSPSLQVLTELGTAISQLPLLVILLRRPDEGGEDPLQAARSGGEVQVLELGPLDARASERLVQERLGATNVDPELATLLYTRSQGNPLLLEAWVDTLGDSGRIGLSADTAFLQGESVNELPDRFEALILTRLERLPPDAQTTLRIASVIETLFTPAEVAELHPASPSLAAVERHLERGAEIGLVYYDRDNLPWMYFSRREVREAIHNSLPFQLRRRLHGDRVAQLEHRRHALPEGDVALLLAAHHCYIEDPRAQLTHFAKAMSVSSSRFNHRDTVRWAQQALKAAGEVGEMTSQIEALDALQHAYALLGENDERLASLDALRAAAEAAGDLTRAITAVTKRAQSRQRTGEIDAALEELQRARQDCAERGLPELEALCMTTVASINTESGRLQDGLSAALSALSLLPETSSANRAHILANVGFTLNGLGRSKEAYDYLQQAREECERSSNLWQLAVLEGNLGIELWGMGRPEEGHARLVRALELKKKVGDRREQALGQLNVGFSHLHLGRPADSLREIEEAMVTFRRLGYRRGVLYCLINLAETYLFTGDLEACGGALDQLDVLLREAPNRALELEGLLLRGELFLHLRKPIKASAVFEQAMRIARDQKVRGKEAHALEGFAYAVFKAGALEDARLLMKEAISVMDALPERQAFPQRLLWRAAEVARALGRQELFESWASRARELLDEELCKIHDPETRARVMESSPWNRAIVAHTPPAAQASPAA